jgi:hypothetical protein
MKARQTMSEYRRPEKWAVIDGQEAELDMKLRLMKDQYAPDDFDGKLARLGELTKELRGLVDCIDKAAKQK